MEDINQTHIRRTISLAERGKYTAAPNPLVGSVVVKNGKVIGEGFHTKPGERHAEKAALENCSEDPKGSVMYVNLEPCNHHGRTPPCTDSIINAGISKVVIGCMDPNPLVSGKGIQKLLSAGIEVVSGVLEEECKRLNEIFFVNMLKQKPFVVYKSAMTLDGKTGTASGDSKWISSAKSRELVHRLRALYSADIVGAQTAIYDDPMLTCRLKEVTQIEGFKNPKRVVFDSSLKLPETLKLFHPTIDEFGKMPGQTIVFTTDRADQAKVRQIERLGVKVILTPLNDNRPDVTWALRHLYTEEQVYSVLLEGGGTLGAAFLCSGLVDKINFFIAPRLAGGANARTPFDGKGFDTIAGGFSVKQMNIEPIDTDFLITGYL